MYCVADITKGTIFEVLPFDDRIEVFELQGKYLLETLERGFSNAWESDPFKGPYVLQVSGKCTDILVGGPEV